MSLVRFGRRAVSSCFVAGWIALIAGAFNHAQAQQVRQFVPPPTPPVPPPLPPVFNPSTPYTLPGVKETPVSPALPSKLPDSSFCSVFDLGPCFPQFLPPIGQDLRLTIVSTDDNDSANMPTVANKSADETDKTAHEKSLPPKDEARHGMEYTIRFAFRRDGEITAPPRRTYSSHEASDEVRDTYRDAVGAALKRCTPLHFSKGMAGAVAGRPIAIRYVDERTLANSINKAKLP